MDGGAWFEMIGSDSMALVAELAPMVDGYLDGAAEIAVGGLVELHVTVELRVMARHQLVVWWSFK